MIFVHLMAVSGFVQLVVASLSPTLAPLAISKAVPHHPALLPCLSSDQTSHRPHKPPRKRSLHKDSPGAGTVVVDHWQHPSSCKMTTSKEELWPFPDMDKKRSSTAWAQAEDNAHSLLPNKPRQSRWEKKVLATTNERHNRKINQ